MPPCRHCGSPSRFNPCWWGITKGHVYPEEGLEYPCYRDFEIERDRARDRRMWGFWITMFAAVGGFVLLTVLFR